MTDVVAEAVAKDGRKAVGLIATRLVTSGSTYQTHLGLRGCQLFVPAEPDVAAIDSIIFGELVHGVVRAESRERFKLVISNLATAGCEGVVLGYTEAGLLLSDETPALPLYDSTALLARAAVKMALGM